VAATWLLCNFLLPASSYVCADCNVQSVPTGGHLSYPAPVTLSFLLWLRLFHHGLYVEQTLVGFTNKTNWQQTNREHRYKYPGDNGEDGRHLEGGGDVHKDR
jgi:hypothetical protein